MPTTNTTIHRHRAMAFEVQAEWQARQQLLELLVQVCAELRVLGPGLGNQVGQSGHTVSCSTSGGCWPLGNWVGDHPLEGASLHACQGLITAAPAASKGPVSRLATAKPLAAAMAAM